MGKNNGNGHSSFVNLTACIAVIFAIIVLIFQLLCHYIPQLSDISILTKVCGALETIKNVCLALVVLVCAFSYASSMQKGAWKTTVYVCCIVYTVLIILGIVLL